MYISRFFQTITPETIATMSRLVKLFPNWASSSSASAGRISYPVLVEPAWLGDFLSCRISEVFFKILWGNYSRDNFSRLVKLCPTRCWSVSCPVAGFVRLRASCRSGWWKQSICLHCPAHFSSTQISTKKHWEIQKKSQRNPNLPIAKSKNFDTGLSKMCPIGISRSLIWPCHPHARPLHLVQL